MSQVVEAGAAGTQEPVPLLEPRDGTPHIVDRPADLAATIERVAAADGPVAVDAERASGYRYTQRAYLVQLRREGVGTILLDPIALGDLSELGAALDDAEWILHAASQDLACLAELGLVPRRLFDTELAGRLLGYPRVALGTLVEELLGYRLRKGHAGADWSTRPLPPAWLTYAALDVELLVPLRDRLEAELDRTGKLTWAREEFIASLNAPERRERADPWRRTSGIHRVRDPRGLAIVRALWQARDRVARHRDLAPGRVLPDKALIAAALAKPGTLGELRNLPEFAGRATRRAVGTWHRAIAAALDAPDESTPEERPARDGPPPSNRWTDKDPQAAARLAACRAAVTEIAERNGVPVENLLPPSAVRQLAWQPPEPVTPETVAATLRAEGARQWQMDLTVPALVGTLQNDHGM